jgi:hypothetical protein
MSWLWIEHEGKIEAAKRAQPLACALPMISRLRTDDRQENGQERTLPAVAE